MVGTDAGRDGKLEVLGLGQTLSCQVAGVEAGCRVVSKKLGKGAMWIRLRGGDDNLGVDELLVKDRVLALLAGGGDQSMALVLEPLADAELVLSGSEKLGNLVEKGSWSAQCIHESRI